MIVRAEGANGTPKMKGIMADETYALKIVESKERYVMCDFQTSFSCLLSTETTFLFVADWLLL